MVTAVPCLDSLTSQGWSSPLNIGGKNPCPPILLGGSDLIPCRNTPYEMQLFSELKWCELNVTFQMERMRESKKATTHMHLSALADIRKHHSLGSLNRILFSHNPGCWKFNTNMSAGVISPGVSLLNVLTLSFLCACLCRNKFSYKDTSHGG